MTYVCVCVGVCVWGGEGEAEVRSMDSDELLSPGSIS